MKGDEEMSGTGWRGRIWGYSGAAGFVQAIAAGYFAWDVTVSAGWLEVLGIGSLMHAVAALVITMMGFVSQVLASLLLECSGDGEGDRAFECPPYTGSRAAHL